MANKTVIITGGNANLGYECAKAIAQNDKNSCIIIAVRDEGRGREAVTRLINETGHSHIEFMMLDLATLDSVRDFVRGFVEREYPPLYAIVCNAGIQTSTRNQRTTDGFELTFGVNHLGHFLLVNLLLQYLTHPARIVVVSSGTHNPKNLMARLTGVMPPEYTNAHDLAYPQPSEDMSIEQIGSIRYSTSKLCNLLFTYELVRQLNTSGEQKITVNAFDPGLMPGTGLARDFGAFRRFMWNRVLPLFANRVSGISSTQRSGQALARLVTDPALETVTGKYYEIDRESDSSPDSHDRIKAAELWETSMELVGLKVNEQQIS